MSLWHHFVVTGSALFLLFHPPCSLKHLTLYMTMFGQSYVHWRCVKVTWSWCRSHLELVSDTILYLSHPDLSSFFYVSVLVWSGRELGWAFYVLFCMFIFLCVGPGMVPNQRQLSIVVSDWEPYLGSLFSHYGLWGSCFVFRTVWVFISPVLLYSAFG